MVTDTASDHDASSGTPPDGQEGRSPSARQDSVAVIVETETTGEKQLEPASVATEENSSVNDSSKRSAKADGNGLRGKSISPEPRSSPDGLRGTNGKIASLRAAYELKSTGSRTVSLDSTKKRLERRPMVNADQSAEITRLKEQLEMEIALRHAYEEKCSTLEERVGLLNARVERSEEDWRSQYEQLQSEFARNKSEAMEEARNAHRQLSDLKRDISLATRNDVQVADSHFAQEMGLLYHEVQNWIVNNFRRAKADRSAEELCARLESISEPEQLAALRPIFQNFVPADKLPIFQATAVCYLMEIFHEPILFGMPTHQEWRRGIRRAVEGLPSVLSPEDFSRWRSTTLDLIRKSDVITKSVESAAESLAEMICIILTSLSDIEDSESRVASLVTIIKRAISLSHLFRVQRASYTFQLPPPGSFFEPAVMEDITLDRESQPGLSLKFATFPSIVKIGSDNGENKHQTNVILKAKVLCNDN